MSPMPKEHERCQFVYADGRHCRMFKLEGHPELCYYHWNRGEKLNDAVRFAGKLLSGRRRLDSARDINRFLNKIARAVISQQLTERAASSLAYISQLMLQSLPHLERQAAQLAARQAAQPKESNEPGSRLPGWFRESIVESEMYRATEAAKQGNPINQEELHATILEQLGKFESLIPELDLNEPESKVADLIKYVLFEKAGQQPQSPKSPAPSGSPGSDSSAKSKSSQSENAAT